MDVCFSGASLAVVVSMISALVGAIGFLYRVSIKSYDDRQKFLETQNGELARKNERLYALLVQTKGHGELALEVAKATIQLPEIG